MNSEKSQSTKPQFTGCVEFVPSPPAFIEFVTATRHWGIPTRHLDSFVLASNPDMDGEETSPPDTLVLGFPARIVFIFGWRLEQLLEPLTQGRIKRVHAQEFPGSLKLGELWVSTILGVPRSEAIPFS